MMLCKIRVLLIVAMAVFFLLSKVEAEKVELGTEDNSEIILCSQKYRMAIIDGEYGEAWDLISSQYRKEIFADNFENFEAGLFGNQLLLAKINKSVATQEIKIIPITANKVVVMLTTNENGIYYEKEDGVWRNGGEVGEYTRKAAADMNKLSSLIEKYYQDNGNVPKELSKLIPFYIEDLPPDLFNDKREPYRYISRKDSWSLYSFGPDGEDDSGIIEYNSKNGILSDGDILIKGKLKE